MWSATTAALLLLSVHVIGRVQNAEFDSGVENTIPATAKIQRLFTLVL